MTDEEDEWPWVTYNFDEVPSEIVRERFPEGGYKMILTTEDAKLMTSIVNQGIDSHLEAVTGIEYTWEAPPALGWRAGFDTKLHINFKEAGGFLVMLRRLGEDGSDKATNLRGSIYQTMQIEEI